MKFLRSTGPLLFALIFAFTELKPCAASLSPEVKFKFLQQVIAEKSISSKVFMELWVLIEEDLTNEGKIQDNDLKSPEFNEVDGSFAGFSLKEPHMRTTLQFFSNHVYPHVAQILKKRLKKTSDSPFYAELLDRLTEELNELETHLIESESHGDSPLVANRKRAEQQQRMDESNHAPPQETPVFSRVDFSNQQIELHKTERLAEFGPYFALGKSEALGKRPKMEDRSFHFWKSDSRHSLARQNINEFGMAAIFDGHGGYKIAERAAGYAPMVIENFLARLSPSEILDPEQVQLALEAAFEMRSAPEESQIKFRSLADLDTVLNLELGPANEDNKGKRHFSGSTAIIAVFLDQQVFFINLGDSRAHAILKDGSIVRMSRDHRPMEEAAAIIRAGGDVSIEKFCDTPRVNGDLAIARSLGDWHCKGLIRKPEVTHIDTSKEQVQALILQCDGVHDGIRTDSHLNKIIQANLDPTQPEQIAEMIVRHAYHLGSVDNISTLVITTQRRD